MAIYYARSSGNINGAIWATTPSGTASDLFSSFTSSDTLMANSFTINVNVNTTVLEVRSDNANSATAGGTFAMTANGVTLAANVVAGSTNNCVTFSLASPNAVSIVGNITGGSGNVGSQAGGVVHSGTGVVNITGNVAAGGGVEATGVRFSGSGTLNITGNSTGGGSNSSVGVIMSGNGVTNITGNILTAGAGTSANVQNSSTSGTVNITGTVTGGTHTTAFGVSNTGTGTVVIVGTAIGGTAGAGVNNGSTGTVTVTRARGNGFGNGSVGLSATVGVNAVQNSATRVYEVEYGDRGQSPTSGPIILLNDTSNVVLFYRTSGGKKTLIDSSASADHPAITNVRSGIAYANNNLTGTCAVPAASSVAVGVAVDNTTGTAVLTQSNVETALASFSSGRLSNCATVATVGQQLSDALSG
jgi:hypothetical protein